MNQTQQITFAFSVCAAVFVYLVVKIAQRRRRRGASNPAANYSEEPATSAARQRTTQENSSPPYADDRDYVFGGLTPVLAALMPATSTGRAAMQKVLVNAGHYSPHALRNFAAVRYLGLVLPLLMFLALLVIAPAPLEPLIVSGIVVGPVLGWAIPGLVVRGKAAERLRQIESGMPDMLDLLNMCVSQGMSVPAALGRVGRELAPVYPALAKELSIVNEQVRIGNLEQALTNFSTRVDVPDVHSFTSLLTQTVRMGTSVSEALADHGDSLRESFKQRADAKAGSAAFKLLFPTVFCLMPAVFMFLLGPAVIELNRFFSEDAASILNASEQVQQATTRNFGNAQ